MTEPAQSSTAEGVQNALLSSPSPNFLICYLVFPADAQYKFGTPVVYFGGKGGIGRSRKMVEMRRNGEIK